MRFYRENLRSRTGIFGVWGGLLGRSEKVDRNCRYLSNMALEPILIFRRNVLPNGVLVAGFWWRGFDNGVSTMGFWWRGFANYTYALSELQFSPVEFP
jgi:hypothetical protein